MDYKQYNSWLNRPARRINGDYEEIDNGAVELFLCVVAGVLIFTSAYFLLFI